MQQIEIFAYSFKNLYLREHLDSSLFMFTSRGDPG